MMRSSWYGTCSRKLYLQHQQQQQQQQQQRQHQHILYKMTNKSRSANAAGSCSRNTIINTIRQFHNTEKWQAT